MSINQWLIKPHLSFCWPLHCISIEITSSDTLVLFDLNLTKDNHLIVNYKDASIDFFTMKQIEPEHIARNTSAELRLEVINRFFTVQTSRDRSL